MILLLTPGVLHVEAYVVRISLSASCDSIDGGRN